MLKKEAEMPLARVRRGGAGGGGVARTFTVMITIQSH